MYRSLFLVCLLLPILGYSQNTFLKLTDGPNFKKIQIDPTFRSESVSAGDINQDGMLDIVIGDVWYEAPDWKLHEIRLPGQFTTATLREGEERLNLPYYSNAFATQIVDANQDGWPDVLCYPVMDQPVYWYENPKNTPGHWKKHTAIAAYHGESPLLVDLNGDGNHWPLAGFRVQDSLYHLGQIMPGKKASESWNLYTIGHTKMKAIRTPKWQKRIRWYAPGSRGHGLGVGDINGDGRKDVLTTRGWYEAPNDSKTENWTLHAMPFDSIASPKYPQYQFAQLPIFDIDQDGDNDFFATSAHRYGVWWFEQVQKEGRIDFIKHTIPLSISQVHAVAMGDLNNNGIPDIITGKRWLSHNGNDPGWDDAVVLIWMEPQVNESGQVQFLIHQIDSDSGVGTQIELVDINKDGKQDILTCSKKGTYLFLQE